MAKFVYRERSPDTVRQRAKQTGRRFDSMFASNVDMFKAHPGKNRIRFLPPTWKDADHYALNIWAHRYIGADGSSYLCLDKMKGKPCPICDVAAKAKKAGDEEEERGFRAADLRLAWILDREGEDPTLPLIYLYSWGIDRDICDLAEDDTKSVLYIDHDEHGYDVSFRRTGEGKKTRYSAWHIDRDASPILENSKKQSNILDFIQDNPLPSLLQYYSADHLEKVLSGSKERNQDDDEDEKTIGRTKRSEDDEKPKKLSRRVEDAEDEDDKRGSKSARKRVDDEEDADEQPKSKSRGKPWDDDEDEPRRKTRAKVEDEEDDEDTKDKARGKRARLTDDEDERPKSSRRARDDEDEPDEDELPKKLRSRRAEPKEDEEAEPRSKYGRRSAKDEDEDEEDDEVDYGRRRTSKDEDEDEEDEPRPRSARRR